MRYRYCRFDRAILMDARTGAGGKGVSVRLPSALPVLGALLLVLVGIPIAGAVRLQVGPKAEECVEEELPSELDTLTASYVATAPFSGGRLDRQQAYDLRVIDPDGNVIYRPSGRTEHKFTLPADKAGKYKLCFRNTERFPGAVAYHFHVGHHTSHDRAKHEHIDPLQERIRNILEDLYELLHDQEFMLENDAVHLKLNHNIRRRVIVRAVFESTGLIAASILQVVYLKRFINSRDPTLGRGLGGSMV